MCKLIIKPRKWQSSQSNIHFLKIILSLVVCGGVGGNPRLGRSTFSMSAHAYFEQIYLIYSIYFKSKSEKESLTKLSSLKHGDISFSPSALLILPGTEMLPEAPCVQFFKAVTSQQICLSKILMLLENRTNIRYKIHSILLCRAKSY